MTAQEMWLAYCEASGTDINVRHEEWAFCGGGPVGDQLTQLVLDGVKTGTASYYDFYEEEGEPIPAQDCLSVVLWDNGEAACVIQNYDVSVVPFDEVTAFHAFTEGEGDFSLNYWRQVHEEIFSKEVLEYPETKVTFKKDGRIVLEKFSVVYPPEYAEKEAYFFMEPSEKYADQIMDYRREMLETGSSMDGCGPLKRSETAREWCDFCDLFSKPELVPPKQFSHTTQMMCIRKADDKLVGMLQFRYENIDLIKDVVGHIGYSVRPSERKKGIAKWMLKNVLPYGKAFGFENILVSCLADNEASRKTILANGGKFLGAVEVPEERELLERYSIDIK